MRDEQPYIVVAKTVVAYGTVQDSRWSVVFFEKRHDAEENSGRFAEFFLADSDGRSLGGSVVNAKLGKSSVLQARARTWPTKPPLAGYVCFLSEVVDHIAVSLTGGQPREFAVHRALDGFPKFAVFFPPFNENGEVIVYDQTGKILGKRSLFYPTHIAGATYGGGD